MDDRRNRLAMSTSGKQANNAELIDEYFILKMAFCTHQKEQRDNKANDGASKPPAISGRTLIALPASPSPHDINVPMALTHKGHG